MKFYLIILFFGFITTQKSIFEALNDTKIISLNESNFDSIIQKHPEDKWFLMFYSAWCPHCQKMLPILQELSQNMSDEHINYGLIDWYFFIPVSSKVLKRFSKAKKIICSKTDSP